MFALSTLLSAANPEALHRAVWGPEVDWDAAKAYALTRTAEQLRTELDTVYAPGGAAAPWVGVEDGQVILVTGEPERSTISLGVASSPEMARVAPRYWRTIDEWRQGDDPERPLAGLRVVLDPGHIGGDWAAMEGRDWQLPGGRPMREGELVLAVAHDVQAGLEALGAEVWLVRAENAPVTPYRPKDFYDMAEADLAGTGATEAQVWSRAGLYFYRFAEIRARADKINQEIRPDVVIALHLNATGWPDPQNPSPVESNHAHILLHGAYSEGELLRPNLRLEMLDKLFTGTIHEELRYGEALAAALEAETGLPPFVYKGPNAVKVGEHPYLWARNLLANRAYRCPVIYLEPWVLNSREVVDAMAADPAERLEDLQLVQTYARAVIEGMRAVGQGNRE